MEIIYHPNFDYELELSGVPSPKMRRLINERFEWLIFWGEDENSFCPLRDYEDVYLKYIRGFKNIPTLLSHGVANKNWWGGLEDIPLEKTLNSKLFAAEIAKEILGFPFKLVDHLRGEREKDVVYKIEYSVSGRGISKKFHDKTLFCEPLYQRKYDIGSRYQKVSGKWQLKHRSVSTIDENFAFRGAKLNSNKSFRSDLASHDEDQMKVLTYLSDRYDFNTIQMDSFLYFYGGGLKAKALSEINYRRTMIDVCYHLLNILKVNEGEFIIRPIKPLSPDAWLKLRDLCFNKAILMSPPGARDLALMILNQENESELFRNISNELAIEL